jgi:hypothetical protein
VDLSETQAAYLAGLLDGEGCFTFLRQGVGKGHSRAATVYPQVILSMTHEPTVAWVAELLGYRYYDRSGGKRGPRWNIAYRFAIYGRKAQELCKALMPYLITKRVHAEVLLAFPYPEPNRSGKRRGAAVVDADTLAARHALVERMKALNQRGR